MNDLDRLINEDTELNEEEALAIAKDWGLEIEVKKYIDAGYTPEEALQEWDLGKTLSFNACELEYDGQ